MPSAQARLAPSEVAACRLGGPCTSWRDGLQQGYSQRRVGDFRAALRASLSHSQRSPYRRFRCQRRGVDARQQFEQFCYRVVRGSKKLSAHAKGMAVDINTLYNPCVRRSRSGKLTVQPSVAAKYADRRGSFPYKIERGDLVWKLFTSRGFKWGGAWKSVKDYQHFEK